MNNEFDPHYQIGFAILMMLEDYTNTLCTKCPWNYMHLYSKRIINADNDLSICIVCRTFMGINDFNSCPCDFFIDANRAAWLKLEEKGYLYVY